MAAEKILKAEKEKRVVYGTKQVLALLKVMGAESVFVSSNFAEMADAERLSAMAGTKLTKLDLTAEEFSSQLKKSFNITAAAIKKGR